MINKGQKSSKWRQLHALALVYQCPYWTFMCNPFQPLDWSTCTRLGMATTIEFENSCLILGPFFLQQLISRCGVSASNCNNIALLCVNVE